VIALQRGLESAFAGAFTASVRYEGSSIFISGTLANCGRIGDAGSDKPEAIMLLSAGTHISSHLALITYPQDRIFSVRSFLKPYSFSTPSHVSIGMAFSLRGMLAKSGWNPGRFTFKTL
jgi:hypothetical protein